MRTSGLVEKSHFLILSTRSVPEKRIMFVVGEGQGEVAEWQLERDFRNCAQAKNRNWKHRDLAAEIHQAPYFNGPGETIYTHTSTST